MAKRTINDRERFIRAIRRAEKALVESAEAATCLGWVGAVSMLGRVCSLVHQIIRRIPPKS